MTRKTGSKAICYFTLKGVEYQWQDFHVFLAIQIHSVSLGRWHLAIATTSYKLLQRVKNPIIIYKKCVTFALAIINFKYYLFLFIPVRENCVFVVVVLCLCIVYIVNVDSLPCLHMLTGKLWLYKRVLVRICCTFPIVFVVSTMPIIITKLSWELLKQICLHV